MRLLFSCRGKVVGCLGVWLFLSAVAFGQYEYNYSWAATQQVWITGVVNRNLMEMNMARDARRRTNRKSGSTAGSSESKDFSSLTFGALNSTRESTIRQVAEQMGHGNAEKVRVIENDLIQQNAIGKFNNLLKQYNFNPSNIADVFSAYVILTWQVYTGKDAAQNIKGVYLYRDAVREAMLANGKIETLRNKDRQIICEKMALYTYMSALAVKGDRDPKVLDGIRKTARSVTGVDVAAYTLTNRGFHKR